nr:hypothetical protein [Tanacetum cinerariifolium]
MHLPRFHEVSTTQFQRNRRCCWFDKMVCKDGNSVSHQQLSGKISGERELMKMMAEVNCSRNKIQKMETELWNLSMKNNDMATYTQRSVMAVTTQRTLGPNQRVNTCFECGATGHYRKDYPKIKNQNHGNKARNLKARGKAYVLKGGDANPGSNTITGTFLLNDHHAYMLFDSSSDRSFVSNTFSTLLDITPSALDVSYAVELADGRT